MARLTGSAVDAWLRKLEASGRADGQVTQARKALGEERLPVIRLHDLRHTHTTLLLADGVPVKVVSERLGHASATITLTVYRHLHPTWDARLPTASPRCWEADAGSEYHAVSRGPRRPRHASTLGS
ncbi:MAG: Integrase [Blastococcus sp.]|nr:Integrase [Blastococcus sp.]